LEEFFADDGASLHSDVFEFRQGRTPGRPVRTEEVVGQFLGDAFEVGPKGFHLRIATCSGSASHPWPPALRTRGGKNIAGG
jgi:hypothetical protein